MAETEGDVAMRRSWPAPPPLAARPAPPVKLPPPGFVADHAEATARVERLLRYQFRNHALLEEALTAHPTEKLARVAIRHDLYLLLRRKCRRRREGDEEGRGGDEPADRTRGPYHATRKTTSIVKSVLDPKTNLGILHWPSHLYLQNLKGAENNTTLTSGWAPFNAEDGTALLGEIDLAFLGVYAIGMFFAGHLGDRVDLRILLTIGMIGTGIFTAAFGAGYWFNIHSFYYFLGMQMMAGLFQSSGWPSVVAVVGNWFAIGGQYLSDSSAGVLSTLFDVGGVVGGILAGHISDHLGARALTAASFTFSAIPALFFYRIYGSVSLTWNIALMFVTGILVNGPYALITTAVSADLGTHSSLNGNSRALATVTAIIDGTGSIGAAVGPLLTGYISAKSWGAVFTMLMASALVAGLLLTRLVVAEVVAKMEARRTPAAPAASDLPVSSMDEP
ncbi:putative glycerol-3-phosphate transporter 1 [Dichanthelium oligosanthes]|uniref:Putative glycerol-3-phosphate transporter 1 n=1 Tax=Dichanthelium oligosanthes TaxID=888268 RepID=A0A1E5UUZ4_9POAL|nr:putative glycerol-3-phosphate transporter 1 [Dichanthelium oligosanthes]